jgi:hypothetical protein
VKLTGKITKGFLLAGATVTGVLTSIAAGTVGLMDHVAGADLDMQLLARRLYLSTDAARKMKTATDALGYSIEEIVWGPPELAERYRALINDQNKMLDNLGSKDFEKQMRMLRDVGFQFTRLKVDLGYFAMFIVKDLSKALWGDENALLRKLSGFADWFRDNMPGIAESIATKVAPAFHDMGEAAAHLWETLSKVDWATLLTDVVKITTALIKMLDFLVSSPKLMKLLGMTAAGAAGGSIIPGVGTALGAGAGFAAGVGAFVIPDMIAPGYFGSKQARPSTRGSDFYEGLGIHNFSGPRLNGVKQQIVAAAIAAGVDPALALAVARQESNFNPSATNRSSGAMGLFQLMPGTAKQMGVGNAYDTQQNIQAGVSLLHDLIAKHGGDTNAALKDFGGFITKDPSDYISSVDKYRKQYASSGAGMQPINLHVEVGDINIAHPNATPAEIHKTVTKAVSEKFAEQAQLLLAQRQGVYA